MMKSNKKPAAMPNVIIWRCWRSTAILRSWTVAGESFKIVSLLDVSTFKTFSKAGRRYERNDTLPKFTEILLSRPEDYRLALSHTYGINLLGHKIDFAILLTAHDNQTTIPHRSGCVLYAQQEAYAIKFMNTELDESRNMNNDVDFKGARWRSRTVSQYQLTPAEGDSIRVSHPA